MELNDYNAFEDHCKTNEIELKRKFIQKECQNIETMEQMIQRKEHDFIDHTLLAPEYMRDTNHFIMDLINFPKTEETSTHNNPNNLPTDLHFHNSLFPVATDNHHHQHTNEARKSPPNTVFMPLNNDFLMPVQKPFNATVDAVTVEEENSVKVVQQLLISDTNVTLDETSIGDDCDITRFNSRKILPHKKRISRKLKIPHCETELQLNVPLDNHKLPHVDQLVVNGGMQQFRCELCGHTTCSQLEFFAHLKQHYEPSTPDTILAVMKTSLDVLGPEKTSTDLCVIKKTDGLDQVFQDFPFENFSQTGDVSVRVVMEPQQHHSHQTVDLSEAIMSVTSSALQQQQQHTQAHQQIHPQQQQQQQIANTLVPEEFSDTEDMLEGIRDKVLIEDTCDTMDLITPPPNGVKQHWFTNNCFNSIDLKAKPFCDVLFSGQFAPILSTDNSVSLLSNNNNISTGKIMQRDLETNPAEIQPTIPPPPAGATLTRPVQTETDLRLHFNHSAAPALHSEPCLSHEQRAPELLPPHGSLNEPQQLSHVQHIKLEETPTQPLNYISYPDSEETLSGNEHEEFEAHPPQNENTESDDNEFDSQTELEPQDSKRLLRSERKVCDESGLGDNGEEIFSENEEDGEENGKGKRYVCNKCQRIFNSCNALKYHNRTHLGFRPHQCEFCDKSFFAICALKSHTLTHTGDKPFECEHCNRKFRQWGDLKYHTTSKHSGEKNHQCEFCGKAFSRKYSLVVHLRIHTSEKNYKCEFCTKTFRASTYLQDHRKIHTGEKPYECQVCAKKFRVCGDLRRHQRVHERKKQKLELLKEEKAANIK